MQKLAGDLKSNIPGLEVFCDEPMKNHTSFAIGGPADVLAVAGGRGQLVGLIELSRKLGVETTIVGNGTNLLVSDSGVRGLVIKICEKSHNGAGIRLTGECKIAAPSGTALARVSNFAASNGLSGLEFACGIPGTLGGAVFMNAGAYDGCMADLVSNSEYADREGQIAALPGEEHELAYRSSFFSRRPGTVIIESELCLKKVGRSEIYEKMRLYAEKRRASQPLDMPSAGSVFKRPEGSFAGALIDASGLRGFSVGGAQVSTKHAGFIINRGGATCREVMRLIEHIQNVVLKEHGVRLETELRLLGEL